MKVPCLSMVTAAISTAALAASAGLAQEVSPYARAPITDTPGPHVAQFFEEPDFTLPPNAAPTPPTFPGKAFRQDRSGAWISIEPPTPAGGADAPDTYLADGSETALAIDVGNASNLLACINQGWTTTAAVLASSNANASWVGRSFPGGGGSYSGSPFDPWAHAGNVPGELFATLIRRDALGSANTRCVIAKSTNGGASFAPFYAATNRITFQDREMVDMDRTTALGGGAGSTHDGRTFMCFDDFGTGASGYTASVLHTISPTGSLLSETIISTSANFRGSQIQPLAGTSDGQCFLMGRSVLDGGATRILTFHEVTAGGVTFNKSSITYPAPGRQLGTSGRWGLNGHRMDTGGYMDVDRTSGPRRGRIYMISSRNLNPGNANLDQADIFISYSTNNAATWNTAALPGVATGKSQFFPMLDVDDNGYVHVAYYQNETNGTNASAANVYYTYSTDGAATWATPVQANAAINTLKYQNPPPDLSGSNYYLIGDYAQIKAAGTGANTTAYILWTTYDKDRANTSPGNKRERVICTTIPPAVSTGACCVGGVCTPSVTQSSCATQGGTFFVNQSCAGVSCPLPHNNCSGAIVISAGNTPFSTIGASTDGPASCNVGQDVWYRFTATCGGSVTALLANTNFVPAIAAYAGATCPPGAQLACNSTGSGDITFNVTAGATYTLRVGSGIGGSGMGTGTLGLFLPPAAAVSQHPAPQVACVGGSATFTVVGTGGTPLSYQWRLNGDNITGATSAQYTINPVQAGHAGSYSCRVSNPCGFAISNSASLTIGGSPPMITQQPPPALAVAAGQPVTIGVVASGSGLSYQWRRNGVNLSNTGAYSGVNTATLSINPVQAVHDGAYTVLITGTCGSTPSSAAVLCYANCDLSTLPPILNVADFTCFLQKFAAGNAYANCDGSTQVPTLNVADFTCFLQRFATGCQ